MAVYDFKPNLPPGLFNGLLFFAVIVFGSGYIIFSKLHDFGALAATAVPVLDHDRLCRFARREAVSPARRPIRRQSLLHGIPVHADQSCGLALSVFRGRLGRTDRTEFRHRDCLDDRRHQLADHVQPDAPRSGRDRGHFPARIGRGLAAREARTRKLHSRIRLLPAHDPAIHHRCAGRGAGKHRQGASAIRRRTAEACDQHQPAVRGIVQGFRRYACKPEQDGRSRFSKYPGNWSRKAKNSPGTPRASSDRSTRCSRASPRTRPPKKRSEPSWSR